MRNAVTLLLSLTIVASAYHLGQKIDAAMKQAERGGTVQ